MNEELQSTNDELQAINDTLRERSLELDEANDFLESILTSVRTGLVVVDTEMRVLAWNQGAEDLWGLRGDEAAGQHLLNLDIGLPMAQLQPAVRSALLDENYDATVRLSAVNRRGRKIAIVVRCSSLRSPAGSVRGSILIMEVEDEPPGGAPA
jgi:two-component system CheB/CheR fusion protein